MSAIYIPNILLSVARNPITALGLPLGLGLLSGYPSGQVARSGWYEVRTFLRTILARSYEAQNLATPPGRPPRQVFPIVWPVLYLGKFRQTLISTVAQCTSCSYGFCIPCRSEGI